MEDKLLKILKIKIDAINRNIDNLNYLNGELERNNKDLGYIEDKISLFKDGDILKFDNIGKDDFDKILLMINSNVADVFKDKTCNYDGIIYIIEGIKKSISLELTSEQTKAITIFIEGLKDKRDSLIETIGNLNESKNRLPETDLAILTNNLDKYNDIVSKFENKLYLTEIDEIGEALNFADILVEEKADIYEFILKYNANIYDSIEHEDFSNTMDLVNNKDFNLDLPDLNTVNVTHDLLNEKEDEVEEKTFEEDKSLDDIKFNLDNFKLDNGMYEEKESESKEPATDDKNLELPNFDMNFNNDYDLPKFDADLNIDTNLDVNKDVQENEENHELNTIELEDIIKKIDAKLKQMETDENTSSKEEPKEEKEEVKKIEIEEPSVDVEPPKVEEITPDDVYSDTSIKEEPVSESIPEMPVPDFTPISEEKEIEPTEPQISLNELENKYSIGELNITKTDLDEVDKMLQVLVDNNLLDIFKENRNILELMLSNYTITDLEELITLVKENLIVKNNEFNETFSLLIETIPVLFNDMDVFNDFKENIAFYKEKNINIINILDNYRELLIINHDALVNNYNKVISYGLEINSDNVKYFLYNKKALKNLDYFIEAIGYEKGFLGKEDHFDGVTYIKKNPYKLNGASRDMLLKLRYTSENNGKIYGNKPGILSGEISNPKVDVIKLPTEYLNSYFNGEYSTIDKNELNNEINNLKEFDMTLDESINLLDKKYKKDELRYQFDNVIISRIKTIRIYNYLKNKLSIRDALIVALTYNSVLKNEEYESIVNIVNNTIGGM